MKKFLLVALFGILMSGLSVTASMAADPNLNKYPACKPGCYCPPAATAGTAGSSRFDGFLGAQEHRANAIRVRDRSFARQLHHQNENGPGMTCFDHAMALTTRLGNIFSDVVPTGQIPGDSTRAFGKSSFPRYGADAPLSAAFNVAVFPKLTNHIDDFKPDSLSDFIGATDASWWTGLFMAAIGGILNQITGFMNQLISYVNYFDQIMTYFQLVVQILDSLGNMYTIIGYLSVVIAAWNVVSTFITGTLQGFLAQINTVANTIASTISGALGSLTNFGDPAGGGKPTGGDCARIQNLWGAGASMPPAFGAPTSATQVIRALTGTGIQAGSSHFFFMDLVKAGGSGRNPFGTVTPGGGNDTDALSNELNLANTDPNDALGRPVLNDEFLTKAMNDLQGTGSLTAPGNTNMPIWPAVDMTILSPGTTAAAIAGQM